MNCLGPPRKKRDRSANVAGRNRFRASERGGHRLVESNRMRLGRFEFVIDFGSFRRITECWSGPGWDFNFSGACVNDDSEEPTFADGRIGVYCDAAPLPLAKAADYTGLEVDLPG